MRMIQRVRSPRYPSISLEDAVGLVRKMYEKDGMNPLDRESAVQHMGYTTLNGSSATALASLKQYGLTNDSGKGMVRLTDLALDLLEPESVERRKEALEEAAFNPGLFATLRDRFPETVPSESNLRAHLLRHKFTGAAVKSIVPAYIATCEYLAEEKETERSGLSGSSDAESPVAELHESRQLTHTPLMTADHQPERVQTQSGGRRMIYDTEEGEVAFTFPDNLSEGSVEDIEEWFALVAKRLRRAAKH